MQIYNEPMKQKKTKLWTVEILDLSAEKILKKSSARKLVKEILSKLDLSHLPPRTKSLCIQFVTPERIKEINAQHRAKNKVTDVLSFPMLGGDNSGFEESLGDILVCPYQAKKQRKMFGTTLNGEIVRLIIHGLLHLLGYDHENVSESEAARMRSLENCLFSLYGKLPVLK